MDIELITYRTRELRSFDPMLTGKLHDAGFALAEDLTYRSSDYLVGRLAFRLTADEMQTTLTTLAEHVILLRIPSIGEDEAKAIQDAHIDLGSLPYINEAQFTRTASLATDAALRIQRDAAVFVKSAKLVFRCEDEQGNVRTDARVSIAYPTEERHNRYHVFEANQGGDVFIENVLPGPLELFVSTGGETYCHRISVGLGAVMRYTLVLNDFCRSRPIDELRDGRSHRDLPSVSRTIRQDEVRDGETFRIVRLSGTQATLLADSRVQEGCCWLLRNLALAQSNFPFEMQLFEQVAFRDGTWVRA